MALRPSTPKYEVVAGKVVIAGPLCRTDANKMARAMNTKRNSVSVRKCTPANPAT